MKRTKWEAWLIELVRQNVEDSANSIGRKAMLARSTRGGEDASGLGRLAVRLGDRTPLALLPLSLRLKRALYRAGVETLGDLKSVSEADLCRWRSIGRSSLDQLRELLALIGRTLPRDRSGLHCSQDSLRMASGGQPRLPLAEPSICLVHCPREASPLLKDS